MPARGICHVYAYNVLDGLSSDGIGFAAAGASGQSDVLVAAEPELSGVDGLKIWLN